MLIVLIASISPVRAQGAPDIEGLTPADFVELLDLTTRIDEAYRKGRRVSGYLLRRAPDGGRAAAMRHFHFVVHTDDTARRQIVAIRGTIDATDTRLDMHMRATPDPMSGAIVHEGFAALAEALLKPLRPQLNMDHEILVTGHSLGGAAAVLIAHRLVMEGFRVARIITFGQPRFTNIAGAAIFGNLPLLRVVHQRDPIPFVPRRLKGDLAARRGQDSFYAHFNDALLLLAGPAFSRQPAAIGDDRSLLGRMLRGIPSDHDLAAYTRSLREKRARATFVPYARHQRHLTTPNENAPMPRTGETRMNFRAAPRP